MRSLHVKVSPELYDQMKGKWSAPVQVLMPEPDEDGGIEMMFRTFEVTDEMVSRLVNAFRQHGRPVGDGVARLALIAALNPKETP